MKLSQKGFVALPLLIIGILVAVIVGIALFVQSENNQDTSITNFDECVAAGNPVMESYPEQCSVNGQTFTKVYSQQDIENASVDTTTYSKLPKDLQAVILAQTKKDAPGCVKDNQIVGFDGKPEDKTAYYAEVGSAIVGIGCEGGANALFAKRTRTGAWVFVASTQSYFKCEDVFNNSVPKDLLSKSVGEGAAAECLDEVTGKPVQFDKASRHGEL